MTEFFAAALSFPTVVFTVLLLVAGAYWLMVILGALGLDVLDFEADGAADGAIHGATEGAAEGAIHGATEGALEGAAHGAAEGALEGAAHGAAEGALEGATHGAAEGVAHGIGEHAAEGAADAAGHGVLGSLLAAIRVKGVPVTIVLSLVVFYGWIISHLGTLYVLNGMNIDSGLLRAGLFCVATVLSFPLASLTARPLGNLLKEEVATTRKDLIGKVVIVDTSRVDARFGTARVDDGAGGFIIQIRCDDEDNGLSRGSEALIMSWEESRDAYEVTPMDNLLAKKARPDKD